VSMHPSPNGFWLSVCIAKVVRVSNHRIASLPRLVFEELELRDGKLLRSVLGDLGTTMSPGYPVFQNPHLREIPKLHEVTHLVPDTP
jgi:hypothetical protein